jgi:PadR family transcriptional regulator PadR
MLIETILHPLKLQGGTDMVIGATGALLDLCVLAIVERGDAYGYALTQRVKTVLEVSESTMYPVMRRLQTQKCLDTYDNPHEGRNRRYYRLTETGKAALLELYEAWGNTKKTIDSIVLRDNAAELPEQAQAADVLPERAADTDGGEKS